MGSYAATLLATVKVPAIASMSKCIAKCKIVKCKKRADKLEWSVGNCDGVKIINVKMHTLMWGNFLLLRMQECQNVQEYQKCKSE